MAHADTAPKKIASAFLIVLGAILLVCILLFNFGYLQIPITLLLATANSLVGFGIAVAVVFLGKATWLRTRLVYFSICAFFVSSALFVLSRFETDSLPFLAGVFFMLIALVALVVGQFRRCGP